jgi:hypothetical protein
MRARRVSSIVFSIPICVTSTHSIAFNEPLSRIFPVRFFLTFSVELFVVQGTTMNVLRFPIQLRTGKNQFLRAERLKERELDDVDPEPIESTVKWRRRSESEVNLPKSGASYTFSSGENSFHEDASFRSKEENYIHYRQKKMRAFQGQSYQREKWLYDTPGVTLAEQVASVGERERKTSSLPLTDDQSMHESRRIGLFRPSDNSDPTD